MWGEVAEFDHESGGAWRYLLTPPWCCVWDDPQYSKPYHVLIWLVGWIYALGSLALGAVVAMVVVSQWGLRGSAFAEFLGIGAAVLIGFAIQVALAFPFSRLLSR